jgi:hypothetical protein
MGPWILNTFVGCRPSKRARLSADAHVPLPIGLGPCGGLQRARQHASACQPVHCCRDALRLAPCAWALRDRLTCHCRVQRLHCRRQDVCLACLVRLALAPVDARGLGV